MFRQTSAFLMALALLCMPAFAVDTISSATVDIDTLPETTAHDDASTLVIYFSTDDTIRAVALTAADALGADIFEIVPEQPYTEADLAYYTDCRADREQQDTSARPGIAVWPESLEQYDVILLGYPIWHGQAPKIMCTLVEGLNLSGKTVVPFCTSASSSAGSSAENLRKLTDGSANWLDVWRVANRSTTEDVRAWTMSLDLGA